MNDRSPWVLALSTANLLVLLAGAVLIRSRLSALEATTDRRLAALEAQGNKARPAPTPEAGTGDEPSPTSLPDLSRKVGKLGDDLYDYYTEIMGDLNEIKRTGKQTQSAARSVLQAMAKDGQALGTWGLARPGDALGEPALADYRKHAEMFGIKVSPGLVEVRGFLNMSPKTYMPIEYFVTRWPENGHETLVHVTGPVKVDGTLSADRLRGLPTAIYKALVAAGFQQGESTGMDASDPEHPKWVAPTGDTVYVGVRYALRGKTHVARATDWIVDPKAAAVLPEDCFRFTGSRRMEDFETGDEMLSAEASGLVVAVYERLPALVEIATPSVLAGDFRYNFARIPKPVVVVLDRGAARLDAERARDTGTVRIHAIERAGAWTPLATAPTLLLDEEGGPPREVAFHRAADGTSWDATDPAIKTALAWRVRCTVDGKPLESTGFEPLYLELLLSKTPIVPQGDGALAIAPIPSDVQDTGEPDPSASGMDAAMDPGMAAPPK